MRKIVLLLIAMLPACFATMAATAPKDSTQKKESLLNSRSYVNFVFRDYSGNTANPVDPGVEVFFQLYYKLKMSSSIDLEPGVGFYINGASTNNNYKFSMPQVENISGSGFAQIGFRIPITLNYYPLQTSRFKLGIMTGPSFDYGALGTRYVHGTLDGESVSINSSIYNDTYGYRRFNLNWDGGLSLDFRNGNIIRILGSYGLTNATSLPNTSYHEYRVGISWEY